MRCHVPSALLLACACSTCTSAALPPATRNASAECPCIDPWASTTTTTNVTRRVSATGVTVPANYGSSRCVRWDAGLGSACIAPVPADWCGREWCYVNASACARSHAASDYFPALRLSYSYATCGHLNAYDEAVHSKRLRVLHGGTGAGSPAMRVAIPGDSGNGYSVTTVLNSDTATGTSSRGGSMLRFAARIFREQNVSWVERPISAASLSAYPSSSYTACVHDVALGAVDMCVGNFWTTSQRKLLAPFSSAVYSDNFYLVTFYQRGGGSGAGFLGMRLISEPFLPFDSEVWCFTVLVLLYVAVGTHICEAEVKLNDVLASARSSTGSGGKTSEARERHGRELLRMRSSVCPEEERHGWSQAKWHARRLGKTSYQAVLGYVSGGPATEPNTIAGRLINIGFGLFIVVSIAMFTAKLTSNLVVDAGHSGVSSLQAALENGKPVCLLAAIEAAMAAKYPLLRKLALPNKNAREVLAAMDAGLCAHAVLSEDAWRFAQSSTLASGSPAHCNKVRVGGSVFSVDNAMPVREALQFPLSWAITKQLEQGIYEEEVLVAHNRYLRPNRCAAIAQAEGLSESLGLELMAGPMLCSVFCTTIAIAIVAARLMGSHGVQQAKAAVQTRRASPSARTRTMGTPEAGASDEKESPVPISGVASALDTCYKNAVAPKPGARAVA